MASPARRTSAGIPIVEIFDQRKYRQRTHNEQNLFDTLGFPPRESITAGRGEKLSLLLHVRSQHLIAVLLPVPEQHRGRAFAFASFFHVDSEDGFLLQRKPLHGKRLERQVD